MKLPNCLISLKQSHLIFDNLLNTKKEAALFQEQPQMVYVLVR
jgi:hypothetical protein